MKELTERQRAIMEEVAMGATYREVAHSFGLSEQTVKNTVADVMRKLNARTGLQAIVMLDDYRPNWRRMIALP